MNEPTDLKTDTPEVQLPALIQPAEPMAQSAFATEKTFVAAQRMARLLCSSTLVPDTYRGDANLGNALIALEMAQRIGASPLAVMQNLYIVHGRPSWSATFIIAALNSTGKFSPLRFEMTGTGDDRSCVAVATDKATGDRLESPPCSIGMAKAESWYARNGSKWKTMPENMLRYRAATFFGRLYAPEVTMGMQTADEVEDIGGSVTVLPPRITTGEDLSKRPSGLAQPAPELTAEEKMKEQGFK